MLNIFGKAKRSKETGKRENGRVRAKGQNEGIVLRKRSGKAERQAIEENGGIS